MFNVLFSFALTSDCFRNKPPLSLLNIHSLRSPTTISNTPAVLVPLRHFNRFFFGPLRSFTGQWLVNLAALSDYSNVLGLKSDMRQSTNIWLKTPLVRFDGTLRRPSTRHNLIGYRWRWARIQWTNSKPSFHIGCSTQIHMKEVCKNLYAFKV